MHPNFVGTEAEFSSLLYRESFATLVKEPWLALMGLLRGWGELFKKMISLFLFATDSMLLNVMFRTVGAAIVIFATYKIYNFRRINKSMLGLLFSVALGLFFSAGIIWTDGRLRVFAVTIPFVAAAVGVVVAKSTASKPSFSRQSIGLAPISIASSLCIYMMVMFLPLLVIQPRLSTIREESLGTILVKDIKKYPFVTLSLNQPDYHFLRFDLHRFITKLKANHVENPENFNLQIQMQENGGSVCLGSIYDLQNQDNVYVVAPTHLLQHKLGSVRLTGKRLPSGLFYVEKIENLS